MGTAAAFSFAREYLATQKAHRGDWRSRGRANLPARALARHDHIEGKGKADTLYGGAGNDTNISGAGSDLIFGEDGDDTLYANPNTVFHDTLNGGLGLDSYEADSDDILIDLEVRLL